MPEPKDSSIISPNLRRQMTQNDAQLSAIVYLREAADLSASKLLIDKSSRGKFVYRSLVEVANRSQSDLVAFLQEHNIKFQPFYIINEYPSVLALKRVETKIVMH